MSKNNPKIYTKPPNGGYGNIQRDLALLKTAVLSDVKTAFTCTPALKFCFGHLVVSQKRNKRPVSNTSALP